MINNKGSNQEIVVTPEMALAALGVLEDSGDFPYFESGPDEVTMSRVAVAVLKSAGFSVQNPIDP